MADSKQGGAKPSAQEVAERMFVPLSSKGESGRKFFAPLVALTSRNEPLLRLALPIICESHGWTWDGQFGQLPQPETVAVKVKDSDGKSIVCRVLTYFAETPLSYLLLPVGSEDFETVGVNTHGQKTYRFARKGGAVGRVSGKTATARKDENIWDR